jgi:hypothetical protein
VLQEGRTTRGQGRPTIVAAGVDKKTGKVYYAESGDTVFSPKPRYTELHPEVQKRYPPDGKSLEEWDIENCADIKVADKALKARPDAKMEDLEIHVIDTAPTEAVAGASKARCANCKHTTAGATVTSDPPGDF